MDIAMAGMSDAQLLDSLLGVDGDDQAAADVPRGLDPNELWSHDALTKAWSAAMHEFMAYSKAPTPAPLGREAQLMASPLWYAPPAPPPQAKKRKIDQVISNGHAPSRKAKHVDKTDKDELDEVENAEESVEDGNDDMNISQGEDVEAGDENLEQEEEEDGNGEPYLDMSQYEKVNPATDLPGQTSVKTASMLGQHLHLPDPPAIEAALPQEPAVVAAQSQQDAVQHALHAWYAAGYATALFHVRSGLVKP